ncbi:PRTase-like protein [Polyplosphaeria fusca]|uniref:adenine phosphoribosyltransferase n=1 Tax=Polyplosphaeria fusca TaxID=682080 RepID=A0A9P4V219_9PLEO|nr:PRTase-like protein [Polyplosphaeria fusca]
MESTLKLIVVVTGKHGAGKDFCGQVWASTLEDHDHDTRAVSISDVTKREYADATGTDYDRLVFDRPYKEHHRAALTAFFQQQVESRPELPEEHFLSLVAKDKDADVLIITGMRDEAPVANMAHLVPNVKVIEVRVKASRIMRQTVPGGYHANVNDTGPSDENCCPSLVFGNNESGVKAAEEFARKHLLPLVHEDLQKLSDMVRVVPDFPQPGVNFRHVLGISQKPDGLALCTRLLHSHFSGSWPKVDAVVCCEAGGYVFASALAMWADRPLVLIRKAGKLPPLTLLTVKPLSYISKLAPAQDQEQRIEVEQDALSGVKSVVVIDDVLSSGETLCGILQLLLQAGIQAGHVQALVVAEFPVHRGRAFLRQQGFGKVDVQSLMVFGGE